MKREIQPIGTVYHIFNKAGRGLPYLYEDSDWWMVIRLLFYLNDEYKNEHWERDLQQNSMKVFERPAHWPEHEPLVKILDFCIHDDHYHLIVMQIKEGGISEFMYRFPNSVSRRINQKYGGNGSVFQGPYQIRRIEDSSDLVNLGFYVRVKNTFERYAEGGLKGAIVNFEQAWKNMLEDPFSSLPDYGGERNSSIIDKDVMGALFPDSKEFKKEARKYLKNYDHEKIQANIEHLI